ncbi:MAG: hypothetical protein R3E32_15200 [Chitinophagales bacterium]
MNNLIRFFTHSFYLLLLLNIFSSNLFAQRFNTPNTIKQATLIPCLIVRPDACTKVDGQFMDNDGHVAVFNEYAANGNYFIAAPHGVCDDKTRQIVEVLYQQGNGRWDALTARYFRKPNLHFNVNRPTLEIEDAKKNDGIDDYLQEEFTADARNVYECYVNRIKGLQSFAGMKLFVEIHGNGNNSRKNYLDIATYSGMSPQKANQVKAIFQSALQNNNVPLTAAVEGTATDPYFKATASKQNGLFCMLENVNVPYLHIEIPADYRKIDANRTKIIAALLQALTQLQNGNVF